MTSRPEGEPSIPLAKIVEWVNEQAVAANQQRADLAAEDAAKPDGERTCTEMAAFERGLGGLATRQSMLEDLKGVVIASAEEAKGTLDTPERFDNPKPELDK